MYLALRSVFQRGFLPFLLTFVVAHGVASAEDDEEGSPGAAAPAQHEPAAEPDHKPDEPAPEAAPDPKPDEPAPAADADHDGKPDEPAPAADADHDGKPDEPAPAADADHDGKPDEPAPAPDVDHDGKPDEPAADADHDGKPDEPNAAADEPSTTDTDGDGFIDGAVDATGEPIATPDPDEPPFIPFDADGDGNVEPDEAALQKEHEAAFADIPNEVSDAELDKRPENAEMLPSISVEKFRELVRIAKAVVLKRLEAKIAAGQAKKMAKFGKLVMYFSFAGLLLLLLPLAMLKNYPGRAGVLFKYSAFAALVFVVTVNLFGGVLYGLRAAQGAVASQANPQIALAKGFFDTLDEHAADYAVMGKELFGPTLEQLRGNTDEQPATVLIANGMKIVKDAKIFMTVAKAFKKISFLFGYLPIILTVVTLVLFGLAIRPTLTAIVKMPMRAASGEAGVGREVMQQSMQRVLGEFKAALGTIGVLVLITLVAGFILGRVCAPALDALINYFSASVSYLQFVTGAKSGLVFLALFGVIFFLVLNLAVIILSMSFFLGKCQKIFQHRFNDGAPLATHRNFFKWGVPSVLLIQIFPLVFVIVAQKGLSAINSKLLAGATSADSIAWNKLLMAGPIFLVVAFIVLFWAVRGVKAIKFLQGYQVKPKPKKNVNAQEPEATAL
jgi:large-conductance mechanosensitive channel